MKNSIKFCLSAIALFLTFSALSSCSSESVQLNDELKSFQTASDSISPDCSCIEDWPASISREETDLVLYMREEEKLARDVYSYFYNMYNLPAFSNISNSEQKHMSSVLCILNQYGIEDPVINEEGVFSDSDLQQLYNTLIEQGSVSLTDALSVGASIEDLDIYDLNEALDLVENSAIATIFNNLRCGSYNHMRAFSRHLNRKNSTFEPQHISVEDYKAILNSQMGNCANMSKVIGRGNGMGQGYGKRNGQRQGMGKCMGNGYGPGKGNRPRNGSGCIYVRKNSLNMNAN